MALPGVVEVPVRDGLGRRRSLQMRATEGDVVLIAPTGGACRMGQRELAEFLGTLRLVAEVATRQRAGDVSQHLGAQSSD